MNKLLVIFFALLLHLPVQAATVPAKPKDSTVAATVPVVRKPVRSLLLAAGIKKPNLAQRMAMRLLEKKLHRKIKRRIADDAKQKDILATISLIMGIVAVASFFLFPAIALLLGPAALVTGIISISKNPNTRSRTKGIIGLVLGAAVVFVFLLAVVVLLSVGFW